jgi:MFS transporter, ACS family, tartrate transporter
MRFVLGLAEAGYFPGILLYLSYWFPQRERARAIALFMTAIPVANIVGAPISGLILDHIQWLMMSSWRWLLILEGVPAIFFGALTYLLLPSGPCEAKFLSQDEQNWLTAELAREQDKKSGHHSISALRGLSSRRVWHLACITLMFQIGQYVVYFWMPQAVKSISSHYSNTVVGVLVMIPHLTAFVAIILVSRSSDRRLERRYHRAIPLLVGGIALVLLHTSASPFLSVAMWSMAAASLGALGPFWSLPNEFLAGVSAAAGIALVNSIGSLGGFFGPYVLGAVAHGVGGIYRGLAILSTCWFVSATLMLLLPRAVHASARDDG